MPFVFERRVPSTPAPQAAAGLFTYPLYTTERHIMKITKFHTGIALTTSLLPWLR